MKFLLKLRYLGLLGAVSPALFGQTAQITGSVTDSTSAVIPDVSIAVTRIDTGVTRKTSSNQEGYYTLPLLQPGKYKLTAQRDGFRPVIRDGIVLSVSQVVRLDVVMEVGAVSESVQVAAAAPLLEADTPSIGQVIENRMITDLPLNLRNPLYLLTLSPGVVLGPNFGTSAGNQSTRNFFQADFRIGGGRSLGQEILIDGVSNVTSDGFAAVIPPVDSVQEFKVQMSTYPAEFGRTTGGIVNMVTKSGTNQLHGVGYEFFRNSVFDANNFFSNRAGRGLGSFKRNQFGGNIGGPITIPHVYSGKDRTFFFFAYEGLRQRNPSTTVSSVPTDVQRAGDFSKTFASGGAPIIIFDPSTTQPNPAGGFLRTPFPNNVIPSARFDPVALKVLSYYPRPNAAGLAFTGANNYTQTASEIDDANKFDARIDHNISQRNRVFGRFSFDRTFFNTPGSFQNLASPTARSIIDNYRQAVVDESLAISPTLIVDLRFGFNRARALVQAASYNFDETQLGFNQAYKQAALPMFPTFTISSMTGLGSQSYNNQPRNTYTLGASVTKIQGRHSIKAGFEFRLVQINSFQNDNSGGNYSFGAGFTQGPDPSRASATAGFGLASFLLGTGSGFMDHITALALERKYYAGYVQDDIKVTKRFTLNLGLRYDVTVGQTERFNRLNWLDLGITSPIASQAALPNLKGGLVFAGVDGAPRNQFDTSWNNLGPRFGFAYELPGKNVIRGGYGIMYGRMFNWPVGVDGFNSQTPYIGTLDGFTPTNYLRDPFPQGFNLPSGKPNPLTDIGLQVLANLRNEKPPFIQQWSFSVQHEPSSNLLIDLSYWGNHGTHLEYAQGNGFEQDYLSSQYYSLGTGLNQLVANPFFGVIKSGALSGPQVSRRQLLLPYPQYTSIMRQVPYAASSIYHAATARLEKRLESGLSLLGSYTLSKAIDDNSSNLRTSDQSGPIQNWENRRAERSVSAFQVPQRLVVSATYELPVGHGMHFGGKLPGMADLFLGGWQVNVIGTLQNGIPIAVSAGAGPIAEFSRLRPNSSGHTASLSDPTVDRWFDTSAFSQPAPFTFGNVGRLLPDVRRDGVRNVDFSIFKNHVFKERLKAQFRFEIFNSLNHPMFGAPVGALTNSSFGVVSAQANTPRQIQFAMKFYY